MIPSCNTAKWGCMKEGDWPPLFPRGGPSLPPPMSLETTTDSSFARHEEGDYIPVDLLMIFAWPGIVSRLTDVFL